MSVPVPVRSFSSLEGIHRVRPQSVKLEYNRPKPSLAKSDPAVTDENLDDINQASLHDAQLSYSAECPLRRSTEVPVAPRPTRSMSLTSVVRPPSPQEDEYPLKLVTIPNKSPRCISAEQLIELINSKANRDLYDDVLILDARFEYEFKGGHIAGARNVPAPSDFEPLKQDLLARGLGDRLCIVIHCEFSSKRGPALFETLRRHDRELNSYPNLSFPEMYVLNGGYKEFYSKFSQYCTPEGYIPMHHAGHWEEMQACMRRSRATSTSTKSKHLTRSSSELNRMRVSPFSSRSRTVQLDELGDLTVERPATAPLPLSSPSGKQDAIAMGFGPLFSFNRSPEPSQGTSTITTEIMEGIHHYADEEDDERLLVSGLSPASRLGRSRPALVRGNTFHITSTTTHRTLFYGSHSTSNLPQFNESEEDSDNFAECPHTSRT